MKKRIVSVVLAVILVVSLFCTAAMAAGNNGAGYYGKYKTITCLGDSASSGYGLSDYEKYGKLVVWETRIDGSYPDLVAKDAGAQTLYSYGASGIRSCELRMLLDASYSGDNLVNEGVMATLSEGEITPAKIAKLRPDYINAVKEADLLILDIGFDDIWLPTIATIYDQAADGRFGSQGYQLKEYVDRYGPVPVVINNVMSYLVAWLTHPQNWVQYWAEWDRAVLKFLSDYQINYAAILERIYELNPDVTIIANGMYNPTRGWSLLPGDNSIEHVLQPFYDGLNAYKESFTAVYKNYYYVEERDIPLINTQSTLPLYENLTLDDSGFNPHPTAEGHRMIADLDLAVLASINGGSYSGSGYGSFTDVYKGTYCYDAVEWAHSKGIANGYTATTFGPNDSCTRGQVVTFLWRAAGCPEVKGSCPFTDVSSSSPYYKAIIWASEKGIAKGFDATHFKPNDTVTRAQFVTFLWRYEGEKNVSISNPFIDVPENGAYTDAILWAAAKGITKGVDASHFQPNANCTRGQVVTFIYRDMA